MRRGLLKRLGAVPVVAQVALLVALSVVAAQAVAFAVVLLAPPPRPSGFTVEQVALALEGQPARTTSGQPLKRVIASEPRLPRDPVRGGATRLLVSLLADRLEVEPSRVRVAVLRDDRSVFSPPVQFHGGGSDIAIMTAPHQRTVIQEFTVERRGSRRVVTPGDGGAPVVTIETSPEPRAPSPPAAASPETPAPQARPRAAPLPAAAAADSAGAELPALRGGGAVGRWPLGHGLSAPCAVLDLAPSGVGRLPRQPRAAGSAGMADRAAHHGADPRLRRSGRASRRRPRSPAA
jgi:hypothetical protein